jgi:hypothetical protein
MISSCRNSDRRPPARVYCFWIWEGKEEVDIRIARDRYNPRNIVCKGCKECQDV